MAKRESKNLEEIYYPIPINFTLEKPDKPKINNDIIRQIIKGAVKGAYRLKKPSSHDYQGNSLKAKAVATQEQMDMVIHLIESLQPNDAIEAALASQFAITYIKGLEESSKDYPNNTSMIDLFEFGHQVLETITKHRTKGAQLINFQYKHNQAQVNNFNLNKNNHSQPLLEVN